MRNTDSYPLMATAPTPGCALPTRDRVAVPAVAPSPVFPSEPGREMP